MHKNKIKSLKEAISEIEKNISKNKKVITDLEFTVKENEDEIKKHNEQY